MIHIKTLFSMGAMTTTSVYCLFFDGYETLDAMGPIEFLHRVTDVCMRYISVAGASEMVVHR